MLQDGAASVFVKVSEWQGGTKSLICEVFAGVLREVVVEEMASALCLDC